MLSNQQLKYLVGKNCKYINMIVIYVKKNLFAINNNLTFRCNIIVGYLLQEDYKYKDRTIFIYCIEEKYVLHLWITITMTLLKGPMWLYRGVNWIKKLLKNSKRKNKFFRYNLEFANLCKSYYCTIVQGTKLGFDLTETANKSSNVVKVVSRYNASLEKTSS